jgi:flagellar P-ring protein precursor FlgI
MKQTKLTILMPLLILAVLAGFAQPVDAAVAGGQAGEDQQEPNFSSVEKMAIKELVEVNNARENYLQGMGIVVGLAGTGDSPRGLTANRLAVYLGQAHDWTVSEDDIASRNIALVSVTATFPAFAKKGTRFDVRVASVGDARSLAGGTLIVTPLRGPGAIHQKIPQSTYFWATAQGPAGDATSATIPNGAIVERELEHDFAKDGVITLLLKDANFQIAKEIQDAINLEANDILDIASKPAEAVNAGAVTVQVPEPYLGAEVEWLAFVLGLQVEIAKQKTATVIVNTINKTVAITGEVVVTPGFVQISQFLQADIKVQTNLQEVIRSLANQFPPDDMVALVLQMHEAGMIQGKVEVR